MQLPLKLLLVIVIILLGLPSSWARSLNPNFTPTMEDHGKVLPLAKFEVKVDGDILKVPDDHAVPHISRKRVATCPKTPVDPNIIHLPCDVDSLHVTKFIEFMPNHCICAYNARYASEQDYHNYKILELEGYFFGQFSERLKRFETEPHDFDFPDPKLK